MLAKPIGFRKYQLYCTSCKVEVDVVSRDEFMGLVRDGANPLCPNCDALRQDEVPHQLLDASGEPYILWISGRPHLIDVYGEASEHLKAFIAGMQDMAAALDTGEPLPCLSNTSNFINERKNEH